MEARLRAAAAAFLVLVAFAVAGCMGGDDDDASSRKASINPASQKEAEPPTQGALRRAPQSTSVPAQVVVPAQIEDAAVEKLADAGSVPAERLDVANAMKVELPATDQTIYHVKAIDLDSGKSLSVALDENGREVDAGALVTREENALETRRQKLDPALTERLATAKPGQLIEVVIRLTDPGGNPPVPPEPKKVDPGDADQAREAKSASDAALETAQSQRAEEVADVVQPAARKLRGFTSSLTPGLYAPVITARLTPSAIRQVAKLPEVEEISIPKQVGQTLDTSKPTVGADVVNNLGVNGTGVRVAQVEFGGRVDTSNPYPEIRSVEVDSYASLCYPASPNYGGHATAVAGIIHRMAPGARLLATGWCNPQSNELYQRARAAITSWGAKVENHSWGLTEQDNTLLEEIDWYFDDLVFNLGTTIVFAAGNAGSAYNDLGTKCFDGDVGSPSRGYNVLTVGNYDDSDTWNTWADDSMWHQSSCVNPYSEHGDREKPEVAAPGTSINTTVPLTEDPDGWNNGGTGTSYAAPVVAAEAAMVIQRQPSLAPWPEIVKAIIMASAPHDVSRDGPWIQPSIDQRDGVGGVWLPWADELARGARGGWRGFNYTCASPSPLNLMTMNLTAGRRIRAVIDWAHNTSAPGWTYHPSADLDLYILNPSGAVVAKSESWDNTYEIVQFTPAVSGTHTLRVVRAANRCFKDPWRLAGAWSPI